MTPRFSVNKEQLTKVLKALLYSLASVVIASVPQFLNLVEPQEYSVLYYGVAVPAINAILVMAKKYLENEQGKLF